MIKLTLEDLKLMEVPKVVFSMTNVIELMSTEKFHKYISNKLPNVVIHSVLYNLESDVIKIKYSDNNWDSISKYYRLFVSKTLNLEELKNLNDKEAKNLDIIGQLFKFPDEVSTARVNFPMSLWNIIDLSLGQNNDLEDVQHAHLKWKDKDGSVITDNVLLVNYCDYYDTPFYKFVKVIYVKEVTISSLLTMVKS